MAVYFIRAGETTAVKIGHTGDPSRILRRYQTYNHERLRLIRLIPEGWSEAETWLHHYFRHRHMHGEWFAFDPEMLTVEPEPRFSLSLRAHQARLRTEEAAAREHFGEFANLNFPEHCQSLADAPLFQRQNLCQKILVRRQR